jgi:pimeloyl-ACP methyl ester carboxylesterase
MPNPPEGSTFLDVDGVKVRYLDEGKGPAVLFLHGYGASLDSWRIIAPKLVDSHRIVAVDLKGFGYTSRPAGDYSPAAQARMVWSVLDQRGVKSVAIVAHSWGASVALAMTLAQPERVRRLALYSAFVYEAQVPSFFLWSRARVLGEVLFGLYYKERIEERFALAFYDDRFVTVARLDVADEELSRPGTVAAALATARGQRYAKVEKKYRTIAQPALIMWGRDDIVTPVSYGERLAADLPNARLSVFPRCGHFPMIEAEPASTRELTAFLADDLRAPPPENEPAAAPAPSTPAEEEVQ